MKTVQDGFVVRASLAAVRAAVVTMAILPVAFAADVADPAVTAQTKPTSTLEVGAGYVSQDSFKFGQYNGLFDKGPYGIFNFDVIGGSPYDSDGTQRYRIYGTNLGLDNRYVYGEFGAQGTYNIWGSYDQLRSNYASGDTYQTPFNGAGSNRLTLPANWVKPIVPQVSATGGNFRALSPVTGLGDRSWAACPRRPRRRSRQPSTTSSPTTFPRFQNVELETTRKTAAAGSATTSLRAGSSRRARARRSRKA